MMRGGGVVLGQMTWNNKIYCVMLLFGSSVASTYLALFFYTLLWGRYLPNLSTEHSVGITDMPFFFFFPHGEWA